MAGKEWKFVLEELNRTIKSHLPPVMPTTEVWQRVFRKLIDLNELRDNTFKIPKLRKRHTRFENEVTMDRREIRCLTNFSRNPNVCTDFVGITDGTPLDEDLGSIKLMRNKTTSRSKNISLTLENTMRQ